MAEAVVAYAEPLLELTDGSPEQFDRALAYAQLCWNLALLPEGKRDEVLRAASASLNITEDELEEFARTLVKPMIRRHEEMFPSLHPRARRSPSRSASARRKRPAAPPAAGKPQRIGRNAPCPCNSGKKYKHCCGSR